MADTIKIDWSPLWQRILLRFTRVFFMGGLASLTMQFVSAPAISTLSELKVWGFTLLVAFLTGGIAALDKAIRG